MKAKIEKHKSAKDGNQIERRTQLIKIIALNSFIISHE